MKSTFHRHFQPVRVEVLTPVAIGSGQLFDPMRYTMCREGKELALHVVDVEQWIMDNAGNKALQQELESDQFLQIRKRLQDDLRQPELRQQYSLARRRTDNQALFQQFEEELSKGSQSRHQLQISEGLRNPLTNRLLLAGSSLKGAIRTAILSYLDQKYDLRLKSVEAWQLQRTVDDLLGKISDHAFKSLRVQDAEVPHELSRLVSAEERRYNPKSNKPGTPKSPTEAIAPVRLDGHETACLFTALTLGFNQSSANALTIEKAGKISQKEVFDWPQLCRVVNEFYVRRFQEEFDKFYRQPHLQRTGSLLERIRQRVATLATDQVMLLRVGHYSHAESLTIVNGDPQGRRIKDRRTGAFVMVGPGTTRTLADGILPFGWILISRAEEAELRNYQAQLQQDLQNQFEGRETLAQQKAAQEEEQQRKAEEEKKSQEEERNRLRERKAAQEAMSGLEKLLDELEHGRVISTGEGDAETFSVQAVPYEPEFSQLSHFEGTEQLQLAQRFKQYFQGDGKWEGKQSEKQRAKITQLCDILGEAPPWAEVAPSAPTEQKATAAPKVNWPKNKAMAAWLEQESNWRNLPLEQLKELEKRAKNALKPKDRGKLEAINNLLKEREP